MDSSTPDTRPNAEENHPEDITSDVMTDGGDESAQNIEQVQDTRFHDGQVLRFVRVRFPGNNKPVAYYISDIDYHFGQRVIAPTDRGLAVGFVNSFAFEQKFHRGLLPIKSITRLATSEDAEVDVETFRQERRLRDVVDRLIERSQLDMQVTQVELSQGGKKAIFSFTAPTRVDFRGLVHEIVGELKMRIELRQVSVRDRAASVGGLGPCGRELCCSSFLAKYGNVGIKLAKNQDLSLNSSKINGVCGQLKCCLTYEDEVYQEKRKKMPRENAMVKTKDGNKGKVIRLHILSEQFETISPEGVIRRYVSEMWDGLAEGLEVPKYFENGVTDLSKTVIGTDQVTAAKAQEHEEFMKVTKAQSKDFADQVFEQLFGAKTLDWTLPDVSEPDSPGMKKLVVPPEEEEEIIYVAPADELDDEEGDDEEILEEGDEDEASVVVAAPAPAARSERPPHPQQHHRPRENNQPRDNRHPQQSRPQHQGPRPPQENRGPRPEGENQGQRDNRRRRGGRNRRPNNGGGGGRPPQN
jgi:cell fate regulator YaaT (PSP1 superfamily)